MRRRALLASCAALFAGACSVLPDRPYAERTDWPLHVPPPAPLPARRRGRVLLVRTVTAGPGLDARGLMELLPDGAMRTDYYERWLVPPAQGVEDSLRAWLAGSGLFAAVLGPGSRAQADLVLETELTALWVDQARGQGVATLGYVLIDQRGAAPVVRMQRVAHGTAKLAGTDARARAAAMTQALAAAFADLTHAIARDA